MCLNTILSRVEEVFSKVAPEDPFLQDASLLQLLLAGSGFHKGSQETHQLAVLFGNCHERATEEEEKPKHAAF